MAESYRALAWRDEIRARFPDWETDAFQARWPENSEGLAVGQEVRGEIIARAPFGLWMDIRIGHPALLLVTEMTGDPDQMLGAIVECHVAVVAVTGQISLTQFPNNRESSRRFSE
jgi:hypothetical protein